MEETEDVEETVKGDLQRRPGRTGKGKAGRRGGCEGDVENGGGAGGRRACVANRFRVPPPPRRLHDVRTRFFSRNGRRNLKNIVSRRALIVHNVSSL